MQIDKHIAMKENIRTVTSQKVGLIPCQEFQCYINTWLHHLTEINLHILTFSLLHTFWNKEDVHSTSKYTYLFIYLFIYSFIYLYFLNNADTEVATIATDNLSESQKRFPSKLISC